MNREHLPSAFESGSEDTYGLSPMFKLNQEDNDKKKRHRQEINKFCHSMSYFDFQDLLEIWARHIAWKKDLCFSARKESFYSSKEWRRLRYLKLKSQKTCELCGWGASANKKMHVDHILGRWLYPELALDPKNLQILCDDCNLGKGITGDTHIGGSLRAKKIIIRRKSKE